MAGRISGSLVGAQRFYVDVPADPGRAQPWRHQDDTHETDTQVRDEAPLGGNWVPDSWGPNAPPQQLPGESYSPESTHERGRPDHHAPVPGADERKRPTNLLYAGGPTGSTNRPGTLDNAGASGAAHGGVRPTGVSAPWANPGGLDLGDPYEHPEDVRRQGLHLNRPRVRLVRNHHPTTEQANPSPETPWTSPFDPSVSPRTYGPRWPNLRRIIRPTGEQAYQAIDEVPAAAPILDPGPVNGWVQ